MAEEIHWLPPLVFLDDYSGNWDSYLEALYCFFKQDFIEIRPKFRGHSLSLKRHPVIEGKEATFWHIISEGKEEAERIPDLRRCERIRWPRPIIEHSEEITVKIWKRPKNGDQRIYLWLERQDYLVVLSERRGYLLLWTAFYIAYPHQRRKYQKEYELYRS
jgi:hypothetical protein